MTLFNLLIKTLLFFRSVSSFSQEKTMIAKLENVGKTVLLNNVMSKKGYGEARRGTLFMNSQ